MAGLLALGISAPDHLQAQGYSLRSDYVDVSRRSHWQAWHYPVDVVEISPRGRVAPRFIQPSLNAALEAAQYTYEIPASLQGQYIHATKDGRKAFTRGGIKQAGSRSTYAARAIDGDMDSYWEPDTDAPLADWWIEIDLGRLVSASRVVVRFAADRPDDRADPFLQFRVHAATGLSPFGQQDKSGALDYALVGGTTQPNADQRVFEYVLEPAGKHSAGLQGRLVQYLRIAATATLGMRAEQVSAEDYSGLGQADKGAIDHVWRIAGEERLVTAARYAELPEGERGGIRYFRRERPRLAEVEIWTVGENLSLGLLQRGGSLNDINPNSFPERAFDGSMRTDWFGLVYRTVGETSEWGLLTMDLGAQFWLSAVRILSRTPKVGGGENLLLGYLLRASDGTRAPDGSLIWSDLSAEDRQLNDDVRLFEDRFEPRTVRFLELRNLDISRRTRAYLGDRVQSVVTEIQIFGTGFPPAVELDSDIIELGGSRNLTTLEWDADVPPGTEVEIRTKTGDELRERYYYYKSDGNQVSTREEYDKLPSFFRGPIVTEVIPGQGWSSWSQPYEFSGQSVRSPSPRRYLLIKAVLRSTDQNLAPSLDAIRVRFSDPVAERVIAEVEPKRNVTASEVVDFQVFVRPEFASRSPGLDALRVRSPSGTPIQLLGVSLGDEAQLAGAGGLQEFLPGAAGAFADAAGDTLQVMTRVDGTLEIHLPRLLGPGDTRLVRLAFRSRVFGSGATFRVQVGNTHLGDVWQRVDSGEAVGDALSAGKGLTVMVPLEGGQIRDVQLIPPVFTPNEDGINDTIRLRFAVLRINAARAVVVDIYDLAGRRQRRFSEKRPSASGMYEFSWDGTDAQGTRVAPGLYVVRIGIDSDEGRDEKARWLVGVAY